MPRKSAVGKKTAAKKTAGRSRKTPAPSYFEPSQLLLKMQQQREPVPPIHRGIDLRERVERARVGPRGALTLLNERVSADHPGIEAWTVVLSPDRTCAFAYAGVHDGEETQRLTHWAVVWSEQPAAHTMWVRHWGRYARTKSKQLAATGAVCRVCKTRDAKRCEGIRRAQTALDTALGRLNV